jgi:hypothetical protein
VSTLRARQKHVAHLKRKLGIAPKKRAHLSKNQREVIFSYIKKCNYLLTGESNTRRNKSAKEQADWIGEGTA